VTHGGNTAALEQPDRYPGPDEERRGGSWTSWSRTARRSWLQVVDEVRRALRVAGRGEDRAAVLPVRRHVERAHGTLIREASQLTPLAGGDIEQPEILRLNALDEHETGAVGQKTIAAWAGHHVRQLNRRSIRSHTTQLVETDITPMNGWMLKEGNRYGDDVPVFHGGYRYTEEQVRSD
jgi:hypothetical protein